MARRQLWLAAGIILAVVCWQAEAAAGDHKYVGAKKCKTCHKKELIGDQWGEWQKGVHSKAFETLKGEKALEIAKEKGVSGPPSESEDCVKCHVTGHGLPKSAFAKKLKHADGIQCESCHGPGKDYRKKKIMSDREKALAKGLWDVGKDPAICTGCHNPESPTFDPKRYELSDGTHVGFYFEQATARIVHPIPEDVKGRYLELEEQQKKERDAAEE